jgi:nicotinate dehydrogenase subunit A
LHARYDSIRKALLEKRNNPNTKEIKEAISGNLCRCGSYVQIIETVMSLARDSEGDGHDK